MFSPVYVFSQLQQYQYQVIILYRSMDYPIVWCVTLIMFMSSPSPVFTSNEVPWITWEVTKHCPGTFHPAGLDGAPAPNCSQNDPAPARSAPLVWKHLKGSDNLNEWWYPLDWAFPTRHACNQGYWGFSFIHLPHTLVLCSFGGKLGDYPAQTHLQPPTIFRRQSADTVSSCVLPFMQWKHILPYTEGMIWICKSCSFHDVSWASGLSGSLAKRKNLRYASSLGREAVIFNSHQAHTFSLFFFYQGSHKV